MANYNYISSSGTIIADTANIKEAVQEEFKSALGEDISLEDSTPQGRLIDAETVARAAVIENNAIVGNLFNVMLSYGVFLDAILANFGMYRTGATSSRVDAVVTGKQGTVIPANSQAATSKGIIFYSENDIIIGESGTAEGIFLSAFHGAIACATGELNKIIDGTFGWETISNPAPARLGSERESDASFKKRFLNSGLYTGKALLENYYKAILDTENVISAFVYDNYTNECMTYDTVEILPRSIYCCVDGGTDEDVANAIFSVKSSGCGYTGNTNVQIRDKFHGALYNVKFDRPEMIDIVVSVLVDKGTAASTELEMTIKNTILSFANGEIPGFAGLNIGNNVIPFEIASGLSSVISGIVVKNLKVGLDETSLSTDELTIHVNQKAIIKYENIEVIFDE